MIKIDSRKIQEGDTFVAIKGYKTDGHNYIEDAIKNGAKKIIADHGNYEVETLIVKDTKDTITQLSGNIILTGGGAQMEGVVELAQAIFKTSF